MSQLGLDAKLDAWVQEHAPRLIDEWRSCCAVPSVSADGADAVREMARWLTERAAPSFDSFTALSTEHGAPVLLGTLTGGARGRLLLYSHYDVVPAGDGWTRPPFGAQLDEGALYARGAGDDKADVMARLHALEAWHAVNGQLPFTVLWLSEGMEEVGSPGLARVIEENLELLRADACLWESYYRSIDGRTPTIGFGSRGVLNIELTADLLDSDTHSAMAGIYRSAALLVTHAVTTLIGPDGRARIPGFYEALTPFTDTDAEVVRRTPLPPLAPGAQAGGALWASEPEEIKRRWLYEPTLNLAAIHAGPSSESSDATVLPAGAGARLDLRLMPDQEPQTVLDAIRARLDEHGLQAVKLRVHNAIRPARSPLDSPLALAVRQASQELFESAEPLLHPVVPGSGPLHLFTHAMPLTAVMPPGTIRPDSGMHGPDENARVAHYIDEVKLTLRIFELLADSSAFGKERVGS